MGNNRDALRRLTRKFPTGDALKAALHDLNSSPEMTAVIMATAIVESLLERVLIASFGERATSTLNGRVFNNRGPCSDFDGKILIGQATGAITGVMAQELQRMKVIRNTFAHARIPVSFDTPEIAKEMKDFVMLNAMDNVEHADGVKMPPFPRNQRGFLLTAHLLCIMMDSFHQKMGGEPLLQKYNDLDGPKEPQKSPEPRPARSRTRGRKKEEG